jgi:hypothetical protein
MKLYDGAPCAQLKAKWSREESIKAALKRKGIGVTYFPLEGLYNAYYLSNYKSIGDLSSLEGLYASINNTPSKFKGDSHV